MRLLLALCLCGLAGCGAKTEAPKDGGEAPKRFADGRELEKSLMGATADEVRKALGPPDDIDPPATGKSAQSWFYKSVPVGTGKKVFVQVILNDGRVTLVAATGARP